MFEIKKVVTKKTATITRRAPVNTGTQLNDITAGLVRDLNYSYSLYHLDNKSRLLSGGKLRKNSGDIVEKTLYKVISQCAELVGGAKFKIIKGDKAGNGVIVANANGLIRTGVDWHLYINNKLKLAVECKSYLDCTRADYVDSVCSKIKSDGDVQTILVAMESAISKDTLDFYAGEGNIDSFHFLMDGTRNSTKPIYLEQFRKEVTYDKMFTLVAQVYATIKNNI